MASIAVRVLEIIIAVLSIGLVVLGSLTNIFGGNTAASIPSSTATLIGTPIAVIFAVTVFLYVYSRLRKSGD